MLVPLVNFSSSFRFRVRQSCAAVSLRLSQNKPAFARLSAWRRHSCHRPPRPSFWCPSCCCRCHAQLLSAVITSAVPSVRRAVRGEPRSLQQPRYAAPASPRCSSAVQTAPRHHASPQWQILTTFFTVLLCSDVSSLD